MTCKAKNPGGSQGVILVYIQSTWTDIVTFENGFFRLKACTREGRFFGDKCVLERVGFFKEFVSMRVILQHSGTICQIFLGIQHFGLQTLCQFT